MISSLPWLGLVGRSRTFFVLTPLAAFQKDAVRSNSSRSAATPRSALIRVTRDVPGSQVGC